MNDRQFFVDLGVALLAALLGGLAARLLRLPLLVGYLLAGTAVGPPTPGFIANEQHDACALRPARVG
jgi:monovalent cation:H+ antiporter-2, CPA2 family